MQEKNGLLDTDGWKVFKKVAKRPRHFTGWLIKRSLDLSDEACIQVWVLIPRSHLKPWNSTEWMATQSGGMRWNSPNSMSMKLLGVSKGAATPEEVHEDQCTFCIRLQTRRGDQGQTCGRRTHDEHTNRQCILWSISKGSENGHVSRRAQRAMGYWRRSVTHSSSRIRRSACYSRQDQRPWGPYSRHRTRTVRFT
jgi:hypothetical protein